jgi:hypothetical protein
MEPGRANRYTIRLVDYEELLRGQRVLQNKMTDRYLNQNPQRIVLRDRHSANLIPSRSAPKRTILFVNWAKGFGQKMTEIMR